MSGQPGGLTGTDGSFPRYYINGNFHTGELEGISAMNFADGRMDGVDDGHTACLTVFLVTSRVGWQTDKSCN